MTDAVVQLLQSHPWIPWIYIAAMAVAVALRAGYPEPDTRPRWATMLLAVADLLHLSPSSPIKMIVNRAQTGSATRTVVHRGGVDKP